MSTERTALLFPGQGAQSARMFDAVRSRPEFHNRCAVMKEILGYDVLAEVQAGRAAPRENLTGSMLTVLASTVSLDLLRNQNAIPGTIAGLAGYSVGQWTALYAAGAISFEQLIRIVERRASFMDRCTASTPGAMIAVIGVSETELEACCVRWRERDLFAAIANYNAPGQYTLSAEARAVSGVMEDVRALNPIKCLELQSAGPWHCRLMAPARDELLGFLRQETIGATAVPVIDNVTGDFLPGDAKSCLERLADQVCQPVRWARGIETLVRSGVTRFIEVGYGNVLTKFGFFINRTVQHVTSQPMLG
jgi:[acyl-carrier-protein] S-malonyltransferase